ncbi:cyclic nucleotide-binding domain-containing protein [Chloroflexota bacterium]
MPKMLSPQDLYRLPLFAGLDHDVLTELVIHSTEITFTEGEWIFQEEDAADALYIVLDGMVAVRLVTDATRQNHADVAELIAGDLVGWSALVEPYIYRMGAFARADTRLAQIKARDLHDFIADYPEAGCVLMTRVAQIMGSRLAALRTRFVSLIEA